MPLDTNNSKRKNDRLEQLKQYTADDAILAASDYVAFTQKDLIEILSSEPDVDVVYLCGERFAVPGNRRGMTYIGVNEPTVYVIECFTRDVVLATRKSTSATLTLQRKISGVNLQNRGTQSRRRNLEIVTITGTALRKIMKVPSYGLEKPLNKVTQTLNSIWEFATTTVMASRPIAKKLSNGLERPLNKAMQPPRPNWKSAVMMTMVLYGTHEDRNGHRQMRW